MKKALFLRSTAHTSAYMLQMAGENWEKDFPTMTGALTYAASIVREDTPMTIYDASGVAASTRVIRPRRK